MHTRNLLFALVSMAMPLSAQGIALLEGQATSSLDLRVLDEFNPSAPGTVVMQQLEIMPIEITGRTLVQELQTDRPRLAVRNGLSRIELPGGGRLFHYRRQAGAFWGYLWVPADGMAHSVLEAAGTSVGASRFADRIGVAADGLHAVVPLTNGNAWVVRLDGGNFASTGTPARLITVANGVVPESVMVGPNHVFFASDRDQVMRCALADGNVPVDCSAPVQANGRLDTQLAMAGDGTAVVYNYGPRNGAQFYLLRETGTSVLLSPPPSKYEGADYLPEGVGHARLLLDEHADRLFYIDATVRDESWMIDINGVLPPLHITDDPVFQPYIGIHIMPAFAGQKLYISIGDVNLMDWYSVELNATGGTVTNLTGTGSLLQPFPAGRLRPTQMAVTGSKLLTTDISPLQTLRLRAIDPATATQQVLFTDLLAPPIAGSATTGAPDLLVQGSLGDRLFTGAGVQLAATPAGLALTPPNSGPVVSATSVQLGGGFGITVFYLPNGLMVVGPLDLGVTQVVMTAAGGCFWNGPSMRYVAIGTAATPSLPPVAVRVCVSGAGG